MQNSLYIISMPDGSKWSIPVSVIASDRAAYFAKEFDGDEDRSLEDTLQLFESAKYEIADWAKGNMDWDDVKDFATLVETSDEVDYQEGWMNGDFAIKEA